MSNPLIQPRLSSHNPFRAQLLTPNPSEASETSSLPSYHATLPLSHPSLIHTPTGTSAVSRIPTYRTLPLCPTHSAAPQPPPITLPRDLPPELTPYAIPEDPPPAYSLTPDTEGGETLVVQGPRQPFQHAHDPFAQQSPPNSQSPLGSVPELPTVASQRQPRHAPPSGRPPPAASVSRQPRYAHSPRASPPSSCPPAASTSNGVGFTVPRTRDRYPGSTRLGHSSQRNRPTPTKDRHPRSTTPGYPSQSNGPTLVRPETYLCHDCRNSGYENFDRSQMRTVKPKEKGLRKIFSWISRRQQLSTAHTPQPQTGLEDEDLQFQAAAQASLEGARSQSFFEQMLWEQEAPLRRHHLDEVTHLEDDQPYGPFSEARNTAEDEDEQLRLAIAETAEMEREQGYTQTITGNEWAKLKPAYTFFFFFLISLVYRDM
ncbi:hypothetical protein V8E53_007881 [Lactarius tabidus]